MLAFNYDPNVTYNSYESVSIESMTQICGYCNAKKCKNEIPGMCCANGQIKQFGNNSTENVSCMDFYAYYFMIRDNSFN